ncbi:MAG TPA: AglZ/HisF2 family acetamidino modification protein [Longimicrobium sp.]|nr:AglZ/HisF2 family acetamidino modification protein [Longimicrobium sp.]
MIQTRVIPCLLLKGSGLVKTVRFKDPRYLGDPINIVRLFNDKEVDELVILDITATPEGRGPRMDLLATLTTECFMPLCYGGGVRTLDDMHALFSLGVEKVSLNTRALEDPALVTAAAERFGSQSVIVSIDVKRGMFGGQKVVVRAGKQRTGRDPVEFAVEMERRGAGELLLNSVDRDGTMEGYDLELIRRVTAAVSVPVVACGGAGSVADLGRAVNEGGAAAAAAGSLFVYQGPHRAVLVNYPEPRALQALFADAPAA